jgi:hypothetical protein
MAANGMTAGEGVVARPVMVGLDIPAYYGELNRLGSGESVAMRLTERQHSVIVTVLKEHFGESSAIWLFGSRVDDSARGGDIDLYVEPDIQDPDQLVEAKLQALIALKRELGEQKIDIVLRRQCAPDLPIYRIAQETGVAL